MFKIHEKFLKILLTLQGRFGLISAVAQIAQSVEQRIENPCVPGSIPGLGTTYQAALAAFFVFMLLDTDTRFRASHLMPSWAALSPAVTLPA